MCYARGIALVLALALAIDLVLALDLVMAPALALARALAIDLAYGQALDLVLAQALDLPMPLAPALEQSLTFSHPVVNLPARRVAFRASVALLGARACRERQPQSYAFSAPRRPVAGISTGQSRCRRCRRWNRGARQPQNRLHSHAHRQLLASPSPRRPLLVRHRRWRRSDS
jgi:hypothetical protein